MHQRCVVSTRLQHVLGKLAKVTVILHANLHSSFCSLACFDSSAADLIISIDEWPRVPRQHMAVKKLTQHAPSWLQHCRHVVTAHMYWLDLLQDQQLCCLAYRTNNCAALPT